MINFWYLHPRFQQELGNVKGVENHKDGSIVIYTDQDAKIALQPRDAEFLRMHLSLMDPAR